MPCSQYSLEDWADYVRNIGSHRHEMQQHLEAGCQHCGRKAAWLTATVEAARLDSAASDPPQDVVKAAKAIFQASAKSVPSENNWMDTFSRLLANLVVSSSPELAMSGVRAGSVTQDRLLFEAGQYSIDLSMEEGLHFGQAGEIIGQIQMQKNAQPLRAIRVQAVSGKKILSETETNQYGEFVLMRSTSKPIKLLFLVGNEKTVVEVQLSGHKGA